MYDKDKLSGTDRVLIRKGFWTPIPKTMFNNLDQSDKERCFGQSNESAVVPAANITDPNTLKAIYAPLHTVHAKVGDVEKIDKTQGLFFPADPMNIMNIQLNSVNILNCPHIQIITDDKYHALARCSLRLR
jgi:hypothetical protein